MKQMARQVSITRIQVSGCLLTDEHPPSQSEVRTNLREIHEGSVQCVKAQARYIAQ